MCHISMNNIMIRNGIYAKQPSKYTNKNYKQHLTSIICPCTAPSNTTNYFRNVDTKFLYPSEKGTAPGSYLVTGFIKQIVEKKTSLIAGAAYSYVTFCQKMAPVFTILTLGAQRSAGNSWIGLIDRRYMNLDNILMLPAFVIF